MQRRTRIVQWALLLGAIGLVARAQDSTAPAETLTVDEAVRYALQHNPSLRTAELDVEKAGDNLSAFRTRRLPSIKWNVLGGQLLTKPSITFDRGVFGTYPGIGPVPGEESKVTAPRKPTAIMFGQILQPLSQQYRLGLGAVLPFSSGHFLRVLAARWVGLKPEGARHFLLATASLSSLTYEHNPSQPVIGLWNDTLHVTAQCLEVSE